MMIVWLTMMERRHFEYQDADRAKNVRWGAINFDLGKPQVQSFLLSSALFLDRIFITSMGFAWMRFRT